MDLSTLKHDSQAEGPDGRHTWQEVGVSLLVQQTRDWTWSFQVGESYPVCSSSAGIQRPQGAGEQPHAQQHRGVCPFPGQPVWNDLSSAKGFLCRSWGPRSLGLAVRGLSFRGQWCLLISWLNSVIPEESRLCVCGSFGSKPCDVSLLFVSLRIRIYPLEAAVFCLVDGVPWGSRWDSLCHHRVGFNMHSTMLYLPLLSPIVFLQVLNFVP